MSAELFDPVPIEQMADAEQAVHEAAASIPEKVRARFETADQLSDEDRKTIIEIARQALARFQPMTEEKPDGAEGRRGFQTGCPNGRQAEAQARERTGAQGGVMSNTTASLRRKINSAGDLQSVVRTMKALAASSIGQYERSVRAVVDYYRTVELGLGACFREGQAASLAKRNTQTGAGVISAVVFGSDQGLVGQFNEVVANYAVKTLAALPGKPQVWAVGERVHARLADEGLALMDSSPCRAP